MVHWGLSTQTVEWTYGSPRPIKLKWSGEPKGHWKTLNASTRWTYGSLEFIRLKN